MNAVMCMYIRCARKKSGNILQQESQWTRQEPTDPGAFGMYIRGIEGDYNTIVGLPFARVYQEMKEYIY